MFLGFISAAAFESGCGFLKAPTCLPTSVGPQGEGAWDGLLTRDPLFAAEAAVIYCSPVAAVSQGFGCFLHFVSERSMLCEIPFINV